MNNTTLYGIRNCDTIKKARAWLAANQVPYQFHDYRVVGPDPEKLRQWCGIVGWEVLLNRRGTTWRKLSPELREAIDEPRAIALMREYPTIIKRPVLHHNGHILVGFAAPDYQRTIFNIHSQHTPTGESSC